MYGNIKRTHANSIKDICENNGFCITHKVCTRTYSFGSTKSSFTVCVLTVFYLDVLMSPCNQKLQRSKIKK